MSLDIFGYLFLVTSISALGIAIYECRPSRQCAWCDAEARGALCADCARQITELDA